MVPPPSPPQRLASRLPSIRLPVPGWLAAWTSALPPLFSSLPGAAQRRRTVLVAALAALAFLLRPWPPFLWLPGWCVGGLLLWALVELLGCLYRPRRWR
ncbi:MAG: hypothetical protein WAM11_15000 [Cyanobium sp.]